MNSSKKKIVILISAIAAVAIATVLVFTLVCFHSWNEATCELPMICEKCGETKGEPLGHGWIEATCILPKTCDKCDKTEGEPLGHEWIEATCEEAKHCFKCGLKQGDLLEHNWIAATCIEPKICKDCNSTDGEPLGHSVKEWEITKEATCTAEGERSGLCTRCNKNCTEKVGMLPHTKSDWKVTKDYVFHPDGTVEAGTQAIICTVCNKKIESREYTVELTLSQKNAVICAYEQISFWHCGPDFLINDVLVYFNNFSVADAKLAVSHIAVDWQEQAILYAKEHCSGASRAGLEDEMRHYGFNATQVNNALKEVGY